MQGVLASLHKGEIHACPERISVFRKFTDNYDWSDITFPIQPKDIRLWESKNKIRVNILDYDVPEIYITKNDDLSEYTQTVSLLLISDENSSHYITITDIEKLLSFDINRDGHLKFICSNCL